MHYEWTSGQRANKAKPSKRSPEGAEQTMCIIKCHRDNKGERSDSWAWERASCGWSQTDGEHHYAASLVWARWRRVSTGQAGNHRLTPQISHRIGPRDECIVQKTSNILGQQAKVIEFQQDSWRHSNCRLWNVPKILDAVEDFLVQLCSA